MTTRVKVIYEVASRLGFNPSLKGADVADQWLIDVVEGANRLEPARALDLGCGGGRNTLYLARHGWDAIGIDMLTAAVDKARSAAVGPAASARFVQGDVTRLEDLAIGDGYSLINDSGCYYGLAENQRDAFAAGVTRVAAPGALLLMAGFTKIPGIVPGISEQDLRRRFPGWELRRSAVVPVSEIQRHTRIPFPLRAAMNGGRLRILRFELTRTGESCGQNGVFST
jgi:SAM-dependent methyltransferase